MRKASGALGLLSCLSLSIFISGTSAQLLSSAFGSVPVSTPPQSYANLTPPPPDDGRLPGGPNGGLVEYVALAAHNYVPGFVVPNTQFGVPYVEFTATEEAIGQTATFQGAAEVAMVINGVVQYPFRPNKKLSPECQVVVNFKAVKP